MNTALFMETLVIMGKGMLGIFLVTIVIIGCIYAMQKLDAKGKEE